MLNDKKKGKPARTLQVYGSYMFKKKDPAIDVLRTLAQDRYGNLSHKTLSSVSQGGGPNISTMHQWFFGKTMRPQNASLEAAGRSMGYRREWVPMVETAKTKTRNGKGRQSTNGYGKNDHT